jgi:hypothetical protein
MQITKYVVVTTPENMFTIVDTYRKFFNALKLRGIKLFKEDTGNGFFEVDSVFAPQVADVSAKTKIPYDFVSVRTVQDIKPTPVPSPKPTPIIQPVTPPPVLPPPPIDKPKEDGNGNLIFAVIGIALVLAFTGKKKGRK